MEREQIAQWLETLHCSHWKDGGICAKSNCELFRHLAKMIRSGVYK